ncbi:DUF1833 family protein [Phaeobacter gallaeciensis]|uniref:DUF1833 family protein n=1 Tax=Phaeobacter gallaeciensis TaxID=60890 RepID=UPI0003D6C537|nr:DUF1833 family protein [Phaeobacter gallaeciensis]AHD12139.1 Domain protein of unknown function [Phaeobacter gallaeciensis DSM 26640]ATE95323.1 Domain protein of unknown function [Phaeobacter gallaeciensis]
MRITSPRFIAATNAQETAEVLLPLITLSHPSWIEPVRIVRDDNPIVHQGQVFTPASFEISLPDDVEEGTPIMSWSIDNTDLRLVSLLRGVRNKVLVEVVYVLASQPDIVEAGPFETEMVGADYDAAQLSGSLTVEPILDEQFGFLTMTPATTPGLF